MRCAKGNMRAFGNGEKIAIVLQFISYKFKQVRLKWIFVYDLCMCISFFCRKQYFDIASEELKRSLIYRTRINYIGVAYTDLLQLTSRAHRSCRTNSRSRKW